MKKPSWFGWKKPNQEGFFVTIADLPDMHPFFGSQVHTVLLVDVIGGVKVVDILQLDIAPKFCRSVDIDG